MFEKYFNITKIGKIHDCALTHRCLCTPRMVVHFSIDNRVQFQEVGASLQGFLYSYAIMHGQSCNLFSPLDLVF